MWRDYLTWNRKEQYGILSLSLILLCLLVLLFVDSKSASSEIDPELQAWLNQVHNYSDSVQAQAKNGGIQLFKFDPNTATFDQLKELGFSDYSIRNLIKYRESGGRIKSYDKLYSIYGMDSSHLEKLKPYVKIKDETSLEAEFSINKSSVKQSELIDLNGLDRSQLIKCGLDRQVVEEIENAKQSFFINKRLQLDEVQSWNINDWKLIKQSLLVTKYTPNVLPDDFKIELNSADTAELVLLKGIGKVFAWRIIKYRRQLGGFYDLSQLQEVEGISPIVIADNENNIVIDTSLVRKIDINRASLRRMKDHPYLNFYMAKDIYEARKSEAIKLTDILDKESFKEADKKRLAQYLAD